MTSARAAADHAEEDVVEPSERVKQLAEDIMHLNLLEVADLTDILQKRLGVSGGFSGMPMGAVPVQGEFYSYSPKCCLRNFLLKDLQTLCHSLLSLPEFSAVS